MFWLRRKGMYMGLATGLAVVTLGASGCEKNVRSAVVAERREPAETGKIHEEEKKIEYYDIDTESAAAPAATFGEQVAAPAVYEADFSETREMVQGEAFDGRTMKVHVTAKAPVEVPDTEKVRLKKVRTSPIKEEQFKNWIEVIGASEDCEIIRKEEMPETEKSGMEGNIIIGKIPYVFGLSDENHGGSFWITADYENLEEEESGLSEALSRQEAVEDLDAQGKKADELLEKMGLCDFRIVNKASGNLTDQDGKSHSYGFYIYERMVEGIPVNYTDSNFYPNYERAKREVSGKSYHVLNIWKPEIMEVTMKGNVLLQFLYFSPVEISDYSDEELFLLPFEEIRQIFENTIPLKMAGINGKSVQGILGNTLYPGYDVAGYQEVEVNITKVQFGFMKTRINDSPTEGILIPVWDFYGTWKQNSLEAAGAKENSGEAPEPDAGSSRGTSLEKPDVSLVTIDARDGSIIDRKCWY